MTPEVRRAPERDSHNGRSRNYRELKWDGMVPKDDMEGRRAAVEQTLEKERTVKTAEARINE